MIQQYGFIVKDKSYDYQNDKSSVNTKEFFTEIVGVSRDDEAVLVAKEMINRGVQVIELCGGFGSKSAEYIISQLDTNIPIGYVTFSDKENQKLAHHLSES